MKDAGQCQRKLEVSPKVSTPTEFTNQRGHRGVAFGMGASARHSQLYQTSPPAFRIANAASRWMLARLANQPSAARLPRCRSSPDPFGPFLDRARRAEGASLARCRHFDSIHVVPAF